MSTATFDLTARRAAPAVKPATPVAAVSAVSASVPAASASQKKTFWRKLFEGWTGPYQSHGELLSVM